MSIERTTIPGNFGRIKYLPCPEGQDARPAAIIGELSCELCGKPMHVKLDKKLKPYAICNSHHPRNDEPCGQPHYLKPRKWCAVVIQAWTNQRYEKEKPVNAPQSEIPAKPVPEPAPVAKVVTIPKGLRVGAATLGGKPATVRPAKPAAKPAAVAAPKQQPAPARASRARTPWDTDD